jgi:D-alanyl-D-alanine carboxypeptidase
MMRKGIKSVSIILLTLIFTQVLGVSVDAKDKDNTNFRVNARCAIALDKESGTVLYEQNAYEIVPMASTTKILTSLIAIEQGNLDKKVTVSKKAASVRGSTVGYKANEEITLRELVFGLMFKSGNDAAIAIAEELGTSIEGFSDIMNHYARGIGILDSHFESPHGLDSSNHYSSAYDLAILTAKGMDYDLFREIVGSKQISKEKYNFTRDYNNINKILWKISGANGVKTGYTGQAGKCLVSSVNNNGKDIIIVVLNCTDRWNVTEQIYKHVLEKVAFGNHTVKELI